MKRALIVAATGGFLNGFLIPDMKLLQEMGYEVHCAANGNSVSTFVPEERFASIGVTFHQIDFSSTSPISKESLTAYKQYKELLNRYHFDFVHVHTPIPGAIVRMATRRKRKRGCVVVYTTTGTPDAKASIPANPRPSRNDGRTAMSAHLFISGISFLNPKKITLTFFSTAYFFRKS